MLSGAYSRIIKGKYGLARTLELTLAVVASRSSLISALLRTVPVNRLLVLDFLRGLSRDELECLADFEGACALESLETQRFSQYRLLPPFFDPVTSERWQNTDDCAHKTFVVLAWLEYRTMKPAGRTRSASVKAA